MTQRVSFPIRCFSSFSTCEEVFFLSLQTDLFPCSEKKSNWGSRLFERLGECRRELVPGFSCESTSVKDYFCDGYVIVLLVGYNFWCLIFLVLRLGLELIFLCSRLC